MLLSKYLDKKKIELMKKKVKLSTKIKLITIC